MKLICISFMRSGFRATRQSDSIARSFTYFVDTWMCCRYTCENCDVMSIAPTRCAACCRLPYKIQHEWEL